MSEENIKLLEQKPSWNKDGMKRHDSGGIKLPPLRDGGRGKRRAKGTDNNWLEDDRYITLTSLLGPRFSPSKKLRTRKPMNKMLTSGIVLEAAYW